MTNWLKAHKQAVKQQDGCCLLVYFLPSESPWLNNTEANWIHGKCIIVDPVSTLTATELIERICAYY